MWLYDNWGSKKRGVAWVLMVVWSIFVIAIGTVIMILGTYGTILQIVGASERGTGTPWSCADNSKAVALDLPEH